jgi:predicted RNA-binding protein with PUA-like domain
MKSEPDTFSIEDLKKCPKRTEHWDGVRNYQARNFMRDQMKLGDLILFYHSSCKNIGIAGLAKVVKESYPDHTQFDEKSKYYDPKATLEKPRWFMVDVKWVCSFKKIIPLDLLKKSPQLKQMHLVQKGSRLSIQPVTKKEYEFILTLTK